MLDDDVPFAASKGDPTMSPLNLDADSEFAARVEQHLDHDRIAWLVTVGDDGTPQPSPVWFLREGESLLIYSQPGTGKLRNIAARPKVAVHFNGDANGGDIVILTGHAAVAPDAPPADTIPAYIDKYRAGLRGIGMSPQSFAAEYSTALRVTIEKVRGH
jgi:PPOX class probable F420-dependent enzyme